MSSDFENSKLLEKSTSGLSKSEPGVILSLSNVAKRLVVMDKVRTDLKGQLRTASTTEEKAMIQEKLDDLEKEMGKKCNDHLEIVKKHQKDEKDKGFETESKATDDEKIKTEESKVWKFESSGIENSGVTIEEDLKTQVKDEA